MNRGDCCPKCSRCVARLTDATQRAAVAEVDARGARFDLRTLADLVLAAVVFDDGANAGQVGLRSWEKLSDAARAAASVPPLDAPVAAVVGGSADASAAKERNDG